MPLDELEAAWRVARVRAAMAEADMAGLTALERLGVRVLQAARDAGLV